MNSTTLVLTPKQNKRIARLQKELADLASMQAFAHPATIKEYATRALIDSKLFTMREVYALVDSTFTKQAV